MSAKPVVDLLIKITTNVSKASGELEQFEKLLDRITTKANALTKKRLTFRLDMKGLKSDVLKMDAHLDVIRDSMKKVQKGKELSKAEKGRFTKSLNYIEMHDRYQKNLLRLKDEEIKKNEDAYRGAVASAEAVRRHREELAKKVETQKQALDTQERELTPIEQMRKKIGQVSKSFSVIPELLESTQKGLEVGKKSLDDIQQLGLDAGDLEVLEEHVLDYIEQLRTAGLEVGKFRADAKKNLENVAGAEKDVGKAGVQTYKDMIEVHSQYIKKLGEAQGALNQLRKAQAKGPPKAKKKRPDWPFSFADMIKRMRTVKMPLMGTILERMPTAVKDAVDESIKLGKESKVFSKAVSDAGATVSDEMVRGWTNIIHQFGIASTYIGQFDKRMRYLSRDIYIMGLYARQLAQAWKTQFQFVAKASVDLGGALEDVGSAWEDVLEPVGDILAPMFEQMAEWVEGLVDLFDRLGLNAVIAGFIILGGAFARILAPALRFFSVMNLFVKSSIPMINQMRALTAGQNEYAKNVQNVGIQMALLKTRHDAMVTGNKDANITIRLLNEGMREQEELLKRIRQNLVNLGGDPSQMPDQWSKGFLFMMQVVKDGHVDLQKLADDPEYLMKEFERWSFRESPMAEHFDQMKSQTPWQALKNNVKGFFSLFTMSAKKTFDSPEAIMMSEMGKRLQEQLGMTEDEAVKYLEPLRESMKGSTKQQKKMTKSTKRGITTTWKAVAGLGAFTVANLMLSGAMTELNPILQTFSDIGMTLVEPFMPLIEAVTDAAEGFSDWITSLTDTQQLLAILGTILGGLALKKVIWWAGGRIVGWLVAAIGKFFLAAGAGTLGTTIMTALTGIPVVGWILIIIGAIALLWKAWKENWLGIRDFTKKVLQGIGMFLDKFLIGPLKWIGQQVAKIFGIGKPFGGGTGFGGAGAGVRNGDVPVLKKGGYIERTGLGMLHRGETILPAGRDLSRATTTNHIYVTVQVDRSVSETVDEYQIGRIVSEEIANQLRRKM